MNQPYIFKKQIITLSVCVSSIIFCLYNHLDNSIPLSYFFIVLTITFLPYIRSKFPYPLWLHNFIFNLPFWIPLVYINNCKVFHFSTTLYLILFIICTLWTVYSLKTKKVHFYITSTDKYEHYFNILYYTYSLITEELYFRAFIISILQQYHINIAFIIIISSALFVFTHFINRWANITFNLKIYVLQFILSILSAIFYYYGKSILYCIILHFFFNIQDYISEIYMLIHSSDSLFDE